MRGFLFDENLPSKVKFRVQLPVVSVRSLGANPSDGLIWKVAREQELVIVTKDADFSARALLDGPPPWVVHLRFGNVRLHEFHILLKQSWPHIERMLGTHRLVNVFANRVEGI